jgi:hypothetical protein
VTRVERVFVDTNTLYPISITDLVLRLAEAGMFDLIWSDHLLAEVERVLVERKVSGWRQLRTFATASAGLSPTGASLPSSTCRWDERLGAGPLGPSRLDELFPSGRGRPPVPTGGCRPLQRPQRWP